MTEDQFKMKQGMCSLTCEYKDRAREADKRIKEYQDEIRKVNSKNAEFDEMLKSKLDKKTLTDAWVSLKRDKAIAEKDNQLQSAYKKITELQLEKNRVETECDEANRRMQDMVYKNELDENEINISQNKKESKRVARELNKIRGEYVDADTRLTRVRAELKIAEDKYNLTVAEQHKSIDEIKLAERKNAELSKVISRMENKIERFKKMDDVLKEEKRGFFASIFGVRKKT